MKKSRILQLVSGAVIIAFFSMPLALNAQGAKPNFTGNWIFNADKSDLGQPPQGQAPQGQPPMGPRGGMGGGNFTAKQEANLLTVERTRTTPDGQNTTSTSKYSLDGKESVNTTGRGDSKSVAAWSANGKSLTIATTRSFERDGQTTEMKSTEVWNLTDQNTLTIVTTMNTPDGERKTTRIYNRK